MKTKHMQWITLIFGFLWIVLPDPIIGPFDDILIAVLEIAPIIKQTVNEIQNKS